MRWFAPLAMLPDGVARNVLIDEADGVFTAITTDTVPDGAQRLPGIVFPGFANCHSHAFHRALRGRTHDAGGTFWTWRARMYDVAARLDPDSYHRLARAAYAEMALAGITSVGEFHYLHHDRDGRPYANPNAMGDALIAAARDAGVRLTLLDACYLAAGLGGEPLNEVQRRFSDETAGAWAERVAALHDDNQTVRHGVAVHSVRAVPRDALAEVVAAADGRPLHVHVSEQPAENDACARAYGATPVQVLAESGVLGPASTAVHGVHLSGDDIDTLASTRTTVCVCPTTEHDLADGIAPAAALRDAGVMVSLGTDQHVQIDMFAEAQHMEGDQRAISLRRGRFRPAELLSAMTAHGTLGWPDAGRIAVGARADLVAVRADTVRTAGAEPGGVLLAASAADIDTVVVDGTTIVRAGEHRIGDVGAWLTDAIADLR